MLYRRLIACVIIKDGWVVQSINFNKYLPIGRPEIIIEFLSKWNIDEIILIDISVTKKNKKPNFKLIKNISKICKVPLCYGGGLSNIKDVKKLSGLELRKFHLILIYLKIKLL